MTTSGLGDHNHAKPRASDIRHPTTTTSTDHTAQPAQESKEGKEEKEGRRRDVVRSDDEEGDPGDPK